MWLSTSLANFWHSGVGEILRSHLALRPASFMPTRPMVEKWLLEGAQVMLGVGIETGIQQLGDDGALGLQERAADVHHLVQTAVEVLLVSGPDRRCGAC
jgi:hypothetical protein